MATHEEIKFLNSPKIGMNKKKYLDLKKKSGIKYIDYKDTEFLLKFETNKGKLLPRRITETH